MKEGFGGTFTLQLLMIFFVLYVSLLGVALNIAKTYRIKNGVINILEQNQFDISTNKDKANTQLETYLNGIPYHVKEDLIKGRCKESAEKIGAGDGEYQDNYDVCIIKHPSGNYYKVIVYMVIEFPFMDLNLCLPISGETMTMM